LPLPLRFEAASSLCSAIESCTFSSVHVSAAFTAYFGFRGFKPPLIIASTSLCEAVFTCSLAGSGASFFSGSAAASGGFGATGAGAGLGGGGAFATAGWGGGAGGWGLGFTCCAAAGGWADAGDICCLVSVSSVRAMLAASEALAMISRMTAMAASLL
jgi:hypothetical protein